MATYYVDSRSGSDANNGASASSAFSSLAKVNSLNLQPGDTVLFARGATFNGGIDVRSGASGKPITYGAFGSGDDPTITGGSPAFKIGNDHDVTIQNLQIKNISNTAISANGASNIVLDHITFDKLGNLTDRP